MPEKKKQHFVPRFYLKNFSNNLNKKTIGVFNLERERFIVHGDLKNQAYKDYFYGKDGEIESELGKIETEASKIFNKIIEECYVPTYLSESHIVLLIFTIFLAVRTEYSADTQNEILDKMVKTIFKDDPRVKDELDKIVIEYTNPSAFILSIVASIIPITFDLKYKLIVNNTDCLFITSDNPVIRYNQFLEKRKPYGSNVGFATKGLQLFLPINPKMFLIFYDDSTYKVGNKKDSVVLINDEKDVKALNVLSCVNAYKNIYFNHQFNESMIREIYNKAKKYRKEQKASVDEYRSIENENSSLIHLYERDIRINLKLSFIKELKKAKGFKIGNRVVHVRNEKLLDAVEEFRKEFAIKNFNSNKINQ
ncbi:MULTISPECIES: DUF4238 domain-containing protein [Bacillaceae]|uniref:DUF4238 domain-containing protein n=1 Tax=Anoxybacillaceae TaxID=3120669 RepID=UPI002497C00B|nr:MULTISPECIES: DUF4238 domain-containing protein [Bacillaceae]GLH64474.1 hypothetical protein PG301_23130 [Parageobacillus sp. G301]